MRNIVYPLIDIYDRSSVLKFLKLYEKSQWWSLKRLRDMQERKLGKMIHHAWNNVPYYRRIFKKQNLRPEKTKKIEDLEKIPVLTHDDIRQHLDDLVAVNKSRDSLARIQTTGTTGHPLVLYKDRNGVSSGMASLYRGLSWCGYSLGEKMAVIWGARTIPTRFSKYQLLKERLRRLTTRRILISAWNLGQKDIKVAIERLNKKKPTFLRGYVSPIYLLASFINQKDAEINFSLKGISTTAEPLLSFQRAEIEKAFRCEVFDQYGCGEVFSLGFECEEHMKLHIPTERVHIEFLDLDDKTPVSEGETGRIVVTCLENYGMPLIRYDTDDLGSKREESCTCGRKLPLMNPITGRTLDLIRLPNGKIIYGGFFAYALEDMEWIAKYGIVQFQVIQKKRDHVVLKIQSQRTPVGQDLRSFLDLMQTSVGKDVFFEIRFVDEIPVSASGKRRYIISEVND
ncbi:MAG: hypothetical protein NWE78_02120 [Candidatus Bathyarchaeota archaeon]|nr:hypothetical protein [Candidatus Bathyarchaeota archaeon]